MKAVFTVTNDLGYDQRMHRICTTLSEHGYQVMLVGRELPDSKPFNERPFGQVRLRCYFRKGFPFYAEYNIRLFFFLLFLKKWDVVGTVDLDTMPAGYFASLLRRKKRVYDAHEYFTEVPEVVDRKWVKYFWELVARLFIPRYRYAYTVGPSLAAILSERYGVTFGVVRNVPNLLVRAPQAEFVTPCIILYQGTLNEGRGIEAMLRAMPLLGDNYQLLLAGEGDLSATLRTLSKELELGDKVKFLGYVAPDELKDITATAWLGINLLENRGLSYYYSLANKFFDFVQAGVPVLTMNFPEYRDLNKAHEVAVLLETPEPVAIAAAVESLANDPSTYTRLREACVRAAQEWNWENESRELLSIFSRVG